MGSAVSFCSGNLDECFYPVLLADTVFEELYDKISTLWPLAIAEIMGEVTERVMTPKLDRRVWGISKRNDPLSWHPIQHLLRAPKPRPFAPPQIARH